jgi:hypothetical protein
MEPGRGYDEFPEVFHGYDDSGTAPQNLPDPNDGVDEPALDLPPPL